jgi:hypothetical protein
MLQIISINVAVHVVIHCFKCLMHVDLTLVLTAHSLDKYLVPQVCRPHISI